MGDQYPWLDEVYSAFYLACAVLLNLSLWRRPTNGTLVALGLGAVERKGQLDSNKALQVSIGSHRQIVVLPERSHGERKLLGMPKSDAQAN
jgi:hypothetical protein